MTAWTVAIVAETTEGDLVLRMTEEQAERLRDGLIVALLPEEES